MTANPFEAIHADPWADEVIDLPSLNAHVSGAIEDAIARQRDVARRQPKELRSSSLVVLGAPGVGKTHLFARLRQRLGPKAVFVHVRPLLNSEMTARFVLSEIAKQLNYATMGSRQIDAVVGTLLAHLAGEPASFPRAFLDDWARLPASERGPRLEDALEMVLGTWQDADESYLRRLLAVPFDPPATQRATMAWLSGRECDELQLLRIGAAASLPEDGVVPALRTVAAVAALGAPIVIVFDQLENLIDGHESSSRLAAYANLAADLVDAARGVVLVHMAIESEWARAIEPAFGASQRSRIAMRTQSLALPTPAQRQELLRMWAARMPNPRAPFPWPFGERRVSRWCAAPGMTPRMLLMECRLALEDGRPDEEPTEAMLRVADQGAGGDSLRDAMAVEWDKQLSSARQSLDETSAQIQCADPARLADGFATAASFVSGVTLETNLRETAQLTWSSKAGKVRVAILHQNHPRSLGSALAKLTTLAEKERVLAFRERTQELPPTWKDTLAKRAAFVGKPHARWVPLERDDAAHLLALASMVMAARSGDVMDASGRSVSLEAVRQWAADALGVASWPVLERLALGGCDAADNLPDPGPTVTRPANDVAITVLLRLRVASVDRLVREVARIDRAASRESTLRTLEAAGDRVQFFGRSIVCAKGDS